jgi:hypothetical protein
VEGEEEEVEEETQRRGIRLKWNRVSRSLSNRGETGEKYSSEQQQVKLPRPSRSLYKRGALVGNRNGSRAERIIRHVCVLETGVEIPSKVIEEFRMKTVENKESGMHSGCQQNVLRSHEFWSSLVPL